MALDFRSDPAAELSHFSGRHGLGVDGIFVDCPTTAVAWRQQEYEVTETASPLSEGRPPSCSTCGDSVFCIAGIVFVGVLIGWALSFFVRWIKHGRQACFPRYRKLSDEGTAGTVEMPGRT